MLLHFIVLNFVTDHKNYKIWKSSMIPDIRQLKI